MTHINPWLDRAYDFGEEEGEPLPPPDPAFDAWLRRAAPTLHAPGAAPVDAMWSAIARAQRSPAGARRAGRPGVIPFRSRWMIAAGLAAALLIGVAVDRLVLTRGETLPSNTAAPMRASAPSTDSTARADLYRFAAVQTLGQAEALLTAYRAGGAPRPTDASTRQLGEWAREVLASTRLLIDSPAGADPQLQPLLSDIELVLVQIVRLSGTPLDSTDRALIDRALRDRDLLPRLRTVVPAGTPDAATASDD